ncbi:hypothetical protein Avbf_12259, partial [Armadillidium vulgare]
LYPSPKKFLNFQGWGAIFLKSTIPGFELISNLSKLWLPLGIAITMDLKKFPKSSEYTTITKCLLKVNDSSIREHTEF